jgi:hypothetical protein
VAKAGKRQQEVTELRELLRVPGGEHPDLTEYATRTGPGTLSRSLRGTRPP